MTKLVTSGARLQCDQGLSPSSLTILPVGPAAAGPRPVATVLDHLPMVNVAPFGMCKAMANPQVAAATAAAMGTLTPMPCLPVLPAPWTPGAAIITVAGQKALTLDSTCSCAFSGTVTITDPGGDVDVA